MEYIAIILYTIKHMILQPLDRDNGHIDGFYTTDRRRCGAQLFIPNTNSRSRIVPELRACGTFCYMTTGTPAFLDRLYFFQGALYFRNSSMI
jgi:hypothetical protein